MIKKIKKNFKYGGIEFKLLQRNKALALYEQKLDGFIIGYEVHIIRIAKEQVFPSGIVTPERERLASASDFGRYGFSAYTFEQAISKYIKLNVKLENERNSSNDGEHVGVKPTISPQLVQSIQ